MNFHIGSFFISNSFHSLKFPLGSIHVYNLNGPGFLMSAVWLILQIICWFCFSDRIPTKSSSSLKSDSTIPKDKNQISFQTYREQYIRTEMFVLFLATFITYFNQTALETIVVVFTEKQFNWTTVHTSFLFAFAGLENYCCLFITCQSFFPNVLKIESY